MFWKLAGLWMACLTLSAEAFGQVRDIGYARQGDRGSVMIEFAGAPSSADVAITSTGVRLDVAGVRVLTNTGFEAPPGGLVRRVMAQAGPGRVQVDFELAAPVATASIRVTERRVYADLEFVSRRQAAPVPVTAQPKRPEPKTQTIHPVLEVMFGSLDPALCDLGVGGLGDAAFDPERVWLEGACWARSGDYDAAAAMFRRVLAFAPEHRSSQLALGALNVVQGEWTEARAAFDDALDGARSDGDVLRIQALLRHIPQA